MRVQGRDQHQRALQIVFQAFGVGLQALHTVLGKAVHGVAQHAAEDDVLAVEVRRGRERFGNTRLFSRRETAKPLLRAIKEGDVFFNLPDMDFGLKDSAFVPFFGVPACTLLTPSRMARLLGMTVQPVIAEMLPGSQGYRVRFLEPWTDFPTDDPLADTAALNRWLEAEIRRNPAQYLWVHRRFKTRPSGEPRFY